MDNKTIIGIDLGGTNMRAGRVSKGHIEALTEMPVQAGGAAAEVVQQVFALVEPLVQQPVDAIGIGVPGMVDQDRGLVFDVMNIPAWKEVALKQVMEERFQVPLQINNDANCFALGEYYFGKGAGSSTMVGLTIGTGLGSGIVIDGRLHAGKYCGAGEFGLIEYRDQCIEYYASGRFFENVYQLDGKEVFKKAQAGDAHALSMYAELGAHLGNAIKTVLYALEPDTIILGGSVREAWPFFQKTMWERINTLAFERTVRRLRLDVSTLGNSGILGAAALHL